jgi:RNA polymerase sigma factor (sigma-70 family)
MKADRASYRMRDAMAASQADEAPGSGDPYADIALVRLVRSEVLALTDRQREALRLRYEQGHTMPQVAELLGITVTAAEKLVGRALGTLRERLVRIREER